MTERIYLNNVWRAAPGFSQVCSIVIQKALYDLEYLQVFKDLQDCGGSAEDLKSTFWLMIYQNKTVLTCKVCGKSKENTLYRKAWFL